MGLECVMLSEISQTDKDKYCMVSLLCGIQKSQTHRNRVEWWLPEAEEWESWEEVAQRVQTPGYRMNKF